MEPAFSLSQKIFQFAKQLNFEAADWLSELTSIVEALPEHEIYQNHLQKKANNKNVKDPNQERADDNYKWGRITEYEKQLEEFDKFRDYTLNKIKGLSKNDIQEGQKIFKAVQTELHRLQEALPIYANKSEIIDKFKNNRVVIVQGNTGCGKSTQLIQYLLEIEGFRKKIALGQPIRQSLETIAQRIREESGMKVGLVPKHMHHLVSDAKLEIHTYRSLIFELIVKDRDLSNYSCIIIDEAHHRFIDTELIVILLKYVLDRNPDLRLIITSATANQNTFDKFFDREIPKINVSGICYDVEIKYVGSFSQNKGQVNNLIIQIFQEEINKIQNGEPSNFDGNILIFVPLIRDIKVLIDTFPDSIRSRYEILPFHTLDDESQNRIFLNYEKPKIIISTRVGETFITIGDLKVVIDSGRDVLNEFDREIHINFVEIGKITKSSANQRAGRTGRTCSGVCYRLYSKKDYLSLCEYEESYYKSHSFERLIITFKALNIQDLTKVKFLEALDEQDKENIEKDVEFLQLIEALDSNQKITPLGKIMNECELNLHHTRILYEAVKLGCVEEVAQTIALFNQDWKLFIQKDGFMPAKKQFSTDDGDFIMLFNILNKYQEQKDGTKWANDNCLSIKALELASYFAQSLEKTINQLKGITSELGPEVHQIDIKQRILKCFFMGYWYYLCRCENDQSLILCKVNKPITVNSTSSSSSELSGISENTDFMVCGDLKYYKGEFSGRIFSKVDSKWLEELPKKNREYLGLDTQNSSASNKKKTISQFSFDKNIGVTRNIDSQKTSNPKKFYNSKKQ